MAIGGSVGSRHSQASLLGQRHLRGGAEVGNEVADFVVFEGFEQALGHHGDGRFLAGEDLGFGDDAVLADEAERELLAVFSGDQRMASGCNCLTELVITQVLKP